MLLKVGITMMAAAVVLALGAAAYTFHLREEPERAVASESASEEIKEPTLRYGEPQRVPPEEAEPAPQAGSASEAEAGTEVEGAGEVAPEPEPQPAPNPSPESGAEPESEPQSALPVASADWPEPTPEQVEEASGPRRYQLMPGAVMGLTVKAIGIYNAPVFDSVDSWALDNGIGHEPETSLPWSNTPQRNVYLAGHRLGYGGTGSRMIFYNLDELENGDEVVLRRRDGTRYEYRVIATFVVNPDESWVTGQVRGRDLVTLQTCTNAPAYDKRLIVRAERV